MAAATLRPATAGDVPLILQLIRELAEYERLADQVTAVESDLHDALFGPRPVAEVILAEVDGEAAGYALFFRNFSTFLCRHGVYLEDLFVRPAYRGRGIGKQLLTHLAKLAVERGAQRLEWAVLDWNTPSIEFYRHLGARPLGDWTVFRLEGDALKRLPSAPD
ncbi:MAG: GNAT family N-acetyltransferase [Gemmatimonadales bacterium]